MSQRQPVGRSQQNRRILTFRDGRGGTIIPPQQLLAAGHNLERNVNRVLLEVLSNQDNYLVAAAVHSGGPGPSETRGGQQQDRQGSRVAQQEHNNMSGNKESGGKQTFGLEVWKTALDAVQLDKADLNRLVMNFLVTEGYVEAAKKFQEEAGADPGVDLDGITDRMEIRKAVQAGHVQEAIERVNDLNPEILEERTALYFHLHQQHFIELVRQGQTQEALEFAQENLAPRGEESPQFLEELERTVALLAFDDAKESPVGSLMQMSQRQKTASQLNAAILSSMSQETEARLLHLVKMLLWSQERLDTKAVYPRINDIASGELVPPPSSGQNNPQGGSG